ncbi:serine/threonine protein phosphatase [Paramagnetospirillum kuznetsovii]|uniref:Serine/threonine protein phosphatase n=1 Tax=Paramagnetospirillum kuznetsovii TaxID=2053833 RepID=A0A364NXB8_9PROT|nr:SpoIIE family protein phosphatase [Paramagnetospirillum kuznetsovii]RAU21703.1 serine/threonine protein phosphatase [Paramagnetospirillum kuznetsovii]
MSKIQPDQGAGSSHLDLMIEMTSEFAMSQDVETTLRLGLTRVTERLHAEASSLFLLEPDTGELVCHASIGPTDLTGLRLAPGRGIVWRTVDLDSPQLVRDARLDPDFANSVDDATGFVTRSILCAPMSFRGQKLGAIELFNKQGGEAFTPTDAQLLRALSMSSALALINTRLVAGMAEQEGFRRELALASEIQRAMLPPPMPPGYPVHGVNLPARGVSGDFYEIVPLADGRIAFAIGDVSGKGVNASLLMTKTASLFRCLAKREDGPGRLLAAIDAELHETGLAGMFVTMLAGILDPKTGRVVLANAGHEPPLVRRDDGFHAIEDGMPPLGIAPDLFADGCPESVVDLNGGALYLFTDGLTEVRTHDGGMLGSDGAKGLFDAFAAMPAEERIQAIVHSLDGAGSLRDDVTLVVVEDVRPGGQSTFIRRYSARAETLAQIRADVTRTARELGCHDDLVQDVVLAVDEACQNVIRHAYMGGDGDVVVQVERDEDLLVIRLMDFAPPVEVAKIRPRALDDVRPGGLGTHLMRSIMDQVDFLPPPAGIGNLLQMVKRISP